MPANDPPGPPTFLAAELSDPAGLCGLLEPPQVAKILTAHQTLMASAVIDEGGTVEQAPIVLLSDPALSAEVFGSAVSSLFVTGLGTDSPTIGSRFVAKFDCPEQALRCAAAIHAAARRSLISPPDRQVAARLLTGIALCTPSEIAGDADERILWLFGHLVGQQILCTDPVRNELEQGDLASFLDWEDALGKTGRTSERDRDRISVCLYNDPVELVNAPFENMFAAEITGWIRPRRELRAVRSAAQDPPQSRPDGGIGNSGLPFPERPDLRNNLVGLALSGGGMRAGVFSLGVVQALSRHEFLEDVDYLSSVSGGGYLGASLAALWAEDLPYAGLSRLGCGTRDFPFAYPRPDQPDLPAAGDSPVPIVHGNESPAMQHVRSNAKLIGSALGLFDPATWAMAGKIVASMVLLWLLFLLPPLTLVALLAIRGHSYFSPLVTDSLSRAVIFVGTALGLFTLWLLLVIAENTFWKRMPSFLEGARTLLSWSASSLTIVVVFAAASHVHDVEDAFGGLHRSLVTLIPVELFALGAVLALLGTAPRGWRTIGAISATASAMVTRTALLLTLALLMAGGMHFIDVFLADGWELKVALGSGLGAATFALTCLQRAWNSKQGKSVLLSIGVAVGGYTALGIGTTMWTWRLWAWTDHDADVWVYGLGIGISALLVVLAGILPSGGGLLNWLSINQIYADAIQKTWVVAARPADPHDGGDPGTLPAWTNVWVREDMTMATLRHVKKPRSPYPLICATLNLPGSQGKKLLDRKADSFVIAPLYFGSAMTRWRPTRGFNHIDKMSLAHASAVSGAAASPNMGERTSTTFSVILTLLNVRMGRWIKNPRPTLYGFTKSLVGGRPLALYWKEMLGMASREDARVYLSDGGHFENLGLYELFRRRCRYIIAVTADVGSVDEAFDLGNLGVALRRARVDFGVEANLGPMSPLMHNTTTGFVGSYYAAGKITYPQSSGSEPADDNSGVLIVIKTGLVEADLTADVMNYWRTSDHAFPYDPTTDQQFDQPQFEAYRQLGFIAAHSMCNKAGTAAATAERFNAVRQAYEAPPPATVPT